MSRKRPAVAKEYFERLLEMTPGDPVAHLGLARIAFAKGEFAAAIPHFESGGDLLQKDLRLVINFAKSYVLTKQRSKAIRTLEKLPQTADPDLHFDESSSSKNTLRRLENLNGRTAETRTRMSAAFNLRSLIMRKP